MREPEYAVGVLEIPLYSDGEETTLEVVGRAAGGGTFWSGSFRIDLFLLELQGLNWLDTRYRAYWQVHDTEDTLLTAVVTEPEPFGSLGKAAWTLLGPPWGPTDLSGIYPDCEAGVACSQCWRRETTLPDNDHCDGASRPESGESPARDTCQRMRDLLDLESRDTGEVDHATD